MIKVLRRWLDHYLSDPEAVMLLVFIVGGFALVLTLGGILMPVFVAIAITILLQCWVNFLEMYSVPHRVAYWIVFLLFIVLFLGGLLLLIPLLWKQMLNLLAEIPAFIQNGKSILMQLVSARHDYISQQYVDTILNNAMQEMHGWGKQSITTTLSAIPGIITWVVYLILVPLMVFFFLRDQDKIILWLKGFLPEQRGVVRKVWHEMIQQMGNYIRGKITEIFIVGIATYFVFLYFNLDYSLLLASLVGLSVVIPYIGAVVVTIPVFMVGYLQWGFAGGFTGELAMMMYAYLFVQFLDGNILVPLLFSEAVNLHPVAIIIAILFFGSIWGFWGVFFAIPLATLVKSVINAWPKNTRRKTVRRSAR